MLKLYEIALAMRDEQRWRKKKQTNFRPHSMASHVTGFLPPLHGNIYMHMSYVSVANARVKIWDEKNEATFRWLLFASAWAFPIVMRCKTPLARENIWFTCEQAKTKAKKQKTRGNMYIYIFVYIFGRCGSNEATGIILFFLGSIWEKNAHIIYVKALQFSLWFLIKFRILLRIFIVIVCAKGKGGNMVTFHFIPPSSFDVSQNVWLLFLIANISIRLLSNRLYIWINRPWLYQSLIFCFCERMREREKEQLESPLFLSNFTRIMFHSPPIGYARIQTPTSI